MRGVPLSAALGIELPDFDITRPCSSGEQAELRQLLCEHHLLLIRSATMTDEDHDRFVEYFGPLSMMGESRAVIMANETPETRSPYSAPLAWHSDLVFTACPNIATSLWAQDVAPGATATGFLNAVRALETLPRELRDRIEDRSARHVGKFPDKDGRVIVRGEEFEREAETGRYPTYQHPIVYMPPHADRRALLVCRQLTSQIVGLPRDEGDALLDALFEHLESAENIYMHRWRTGDVLIWDNISLQHCRPAEIGAITRRIRRLSIDGWNTGAGVRKWFAPVTLPPP